MLRDSYSVHFTDYELEEKLKDVLKLMDDFRTNISLYTWNTIEKHINDCIEEFEDRDKQEQETL